MKQWRASRRQEVLQRPSVTGTHSASVTIPLLAHKRTTYFKSVHKKCFKVWGWMDGGGEGIIWAGEQDVSFTISPLLVSGLGDEYTVHTFPLHWEDKFFPRFL